MLAKVVENSKKRKLDELNVAYRLAGKVKKKIEKKKTKKKNQNQKIKNK